MSDTLDSGAFLALEGNDRRMWRRLKGSLQAASPPKTHGGVVAQVWRGGPGRQTRPDPGRRPRSRMRRTNVEYDAP